MAHSFAISIILVLTCLQCAQLSSLKYTHSLYLDKNKLYHISWGFDDKEIEFEILVNATGYIGFGLSPDGSMANADLAIGTTKSGQFSLKDYHGFANGTLLEDSVQEWTLISSDQKTEQTKLKIKRKLITNDKNGINITGDTMRVIWAYSNKEFNQENFTLGGYKSLYLLQTQRPDIPIPANATKLLVTLNQVEIPNHSTTYWCATTQIPAYKEKMHVIKISPIITEGNEMFVHHMLLYECKSEEPVVNGSKGHDCDSPNMPGNLRRCRKLIFGWAVGGTDFPLPEHVGFPIGGTAEKRVFLLEMHYDNPRRISGQVDSSGLELLLIPARRDFDAGVLEIGKAVSERRLDTMKIPPYQSAFRYQALCSSKCIYDLFPNQNNKAPIKMFAALLHGHLLTTGVVVYHIRNNQRIATIAADRNYDFNYQEMVFFKKEIEFLPGDDLKVECVYNSLNRNVFTMGGYATTDEMCLAYILYYPKINTITCISSIQIDGVAWTEDQLGTENVVRFKKEEISEEFEKTVNGIGNKSSTLVRYCSNGNIWKQGKQNTRDVAILSFNIPEAPEQPPGSKAGIGLLNMFGFSLRSLFLVVVLFYLAIQ